MNSKTRTLAGVATAVASLGVGVFGARAIDPEESGSSATAGAEDATVLVDGVATPAAEVGDVVDVEVPIVAPVFVGDDPATIGRLLAGPPAAQEGAGQSYDGTGSEIIGSITQQMVFAQSGDGADGADDADQLQVLSLPYVFASIAERFLPFPTHAFDICAGRRPGSHVSVPRAFGSRSGCPVGFAGTIRGLFAWPTPFIRGDVNHHLEPSDGISQTCPADTPRAGDNQTAVTAFSSVPMVNVRAEWRLYPTLRTWNSIDVAATSAAHAEHWAAERATGRFTNDALLPHCFVIDTDWNRSYEVRIIGTDAAGNTYESDQVIVWSRTIGRPPTQVSEIDPVALRAYAASYTVDGGSVSYRVRPMESADDTECTSGGTTSSDLHYTDLPPVEAPSEEYPRLAVGYIPLTAGANLLCASIYDASGALLGIDIIVINTPTLQRPVVTLAGIRLNPGVTIAGPESSETGGGHLFVRAYGLAYDGVCAPPWRNPSDLTGTTDGADLQVLFDCRSGTVSPAGSSITAYTSRLSGTDTSRRTFRSIPISLDVCDPTCPSRPAEWFEVPIASADGERCGETGTEFAAECTATDGVAILRVDYITIEGTPGATGTATLLSSDAPTERAPVLRIIDTRIDSFADWGAIPLALTIESDVVVDLVGVTPTTTAVTEAGCPLMATFEPSRGTVFDVVLTVCAGSLNGLTVEVVDEVGVHYETELAVAGEVQPMIQSDAVHTTVELLGATDGFGFAEVSHLVASPSGHFWTLWGYEWSGAAGSAPGCVSLDNSVFQSDIDPPMTLQPNAGLSVQLELLVTAAGADDCDAGGGESIFVDDVPGFASVSRLQSGEPIVFPPRPGQPIQVRITVTADWYLTLDGVRVSD